MNYIINYFKSFLIPIISILIMSIFLSISNLLGFKTNKIIILICMIIVMFISGLYYTKNITKKKYLHGLLYGTITCILLFLLSLLFKSNYQYNLVIYYLVLIISSTLGAMLSSLKIK